MVRIGKMQTQITLELDSDLVQKAKNIADKSGQSLSKLVEDYFEHLEHPMTLNDDELAPITKSLAGSLKNATVDEEDYYKYLEEKHS